MVTSHNVVKQPAACTYNSWGLPVQRLKWNIQRKTAPSLRWKRKPNSDLVVASNITISNVAETWLTPATKMVKVLLNTEKLTNHGNLWLWYFFCVRSWTVGQISKKALRGKHIWQPADLVDTCYRKSNVLQIMQIMPEHRNFSQQ